MTLGELRSKMTYQELWVWVTYFGLMNDEREEQMKKEPETPPLDLVIGGFFCGYCTSRYPYSGKGVI